MRKLQSSEFLATIFFIHENWQTTFDTKLKCPECYYVYLNEKIKRHMCPILDNINCKACKFDYPNNAMKRHLLTYYKCKQYYEENESEKKIE